MRFDSLLSMSKRASPRDLPELMDGACSYEDFRACLQSLAQVNLRLGGYRPTLAWLQSFASESIRGAHLVDVGSGGGDLLRQIAAWASRQGIALQLTGIDLNPYAKRVAEEFTPRQLGIRWVTDDALLYQPDEPIDLIVSSLMAHHLEDAELVALLRWMEESARAGWFINDLKRSAWTCFIFGWIAKLAGWHRFVQHDGPVSFRRAFRRADWVHLLTTAGIPVDSVTIRDWRPGRLCVGRRK